MKIRTDFVTNSSSSSFVLARKGEFNQAQKDAIIKLVEEHFMGKHVISNTEELDKLAERDYSLGEGRENRTKAEDAINRGMKVLYDEVDFEIPMYNLEDIYAAIWKALKENSDGNFEIIDGDLRY